MSATSSVVSSSIGAAAGGATSLSAGLILGMNPDALIIGAIAAIVVSILADKIDNRPKAFAAVILSSITAALSAPAVAAYAAENYPQFVTTTPPQAIQLLCSLLVGACGPLGIPFAIQWFNKKGEEVTK